MSFKWVLFIALRYIFRSQKKSPSSVLSILGIATGVFALIVIIAVMNGFQLGFIESILEVSSYHMRLSPVAAEKITDARKAVLAVPGVESAVPFQEFQGLLRGKRGGQQAAVVRGLPPDALALDPGMAARLEFEEGSFDLATKPLQKDGQNILLGSELSRRLGVRCGDEVTLFSIPAMFSAGESDEDDGPLAFTVAGIFRTGFYEYDTSWAFTTMESASVFSDAGPALGIKLKNRFNDQRVQEAAKKIPADFSGAEFTSWRDYNRSFFGALRTEKLFMFILVGLIFIVVGLNIYQAQRRAVLEHREEIGLLRAIGGGEWSVRLIFVCDGAIIGLIGAVTGLVLGLLVASNISAFFTVIETIVNFIIHIVNVIANFFKADSLAGFSLFSPAVFYLKEIPSRIIPGEAVLIFMFGLLSAVAAAWFAARKIARILVAEVLRYE